MTFKSVHPVAAVAIAAIGLCATARADEADASTRLHALFDDEWEHTLREYPEFASRLGDKRYNDRWTDVSLDAYARRHEHNQRVLEELRSIPHDQLPPQDRINYRLFEREYAMNVEGYAYRRFLLPINQMGGIHTENQLADALVFTNVKDYDDWIARLRALPDAVDQTIALMREGMRVGVVHPKIIMQRVPDQIADQIVDDPADSLFFDPFESFPPGIEAADRDRLVADAKQAVAERVIPAYKRLHAFFVNDYLPACTDEVGAWRLPRGREMYAFLARDFTTTEMSPEEIHRLGLEEVERIRGEMQAIIEQVGFKGDFDAFLTHLRDDETFYYKNPDELFEAYQALCKRIDPLLVKLFGRLPRLPYGVEPIPAHTAPDAPTAYYRQPAADGSRAGTIQVNLDKPGTRPKYEMEALMLHEGVPGHHLQIALAMELGDLPAFRRYGGYTAFVEGWGLYSESLGGELGLYQDPYSKFGQLTYEMWRACRLVVDTGMHHFEWPRQKAIDFILAHAGKSENDVLNEIDRYIAWPGQALAYKIGELKIKSLRARAADALGERFDVRAFHDALLGSGAVTLDVLEDQINAWIATQKKKVSG